MKKIITSKLEMADFAKSIADELENGSIIGLKGSLGVGKSFFASNFIQHLVENEINVLSPTFNLMYNYSSKKGEIFHFDLYRLKKVEELENIDFYACLQNGICLIEWPEIIEEFLKKNCAKNYREIEIRMLEEERREVLIS